MARADIPLPRDVQSELHDAVDAMGEKVARGTLVEISASKPPVNNPTVCTCTRYSERREDGYLHFWYKADPNCKYIHLQPLPIAHKVKL